MLNCPTTYFVVNSHFVCNDSTECVACFTLIQRFIISVVDLRAAFFWTFFLLSLFFFRTQFYTKYKQPNLTHKKITWDHILLITRKYTNRLIIIVGLSCSQFNNSPLIWKNKWKIHLINENCIQYGGHTNQIPPSRNLSLSTIQSLFRLINSVFLVLIYSFLILQRIFGHKVCMSASHATHIFISSWFLFFVVKLCSLCNHEHVFVQWFSSKLIIHYFFYFEQIFLVWKFSFIWFNDNSLIQYLLEK